MGVGAPELREVGHLGRIFRQQHLPKIEPFIHTGRCVQHSRGCVQHSPGCERTSNECVSVLNECAGWTPGSRPPAGAPHTLGPWLRVEG